MAQWGLRGPLPPPLPTASSSLPTKPGLIEPGKAGGEPSLPTPVNLDAIMSQGQSLLQLPLTFNLMKCVTSKPSFLHGLL